MTANIDHYWLDPSWYNFMSSEFGGVAVKLVGLVVFTVFFRWGYVKVHRHLECQVAGCSNWGHPVHETSMRACKLHHPHLSPTGHTAEHIRKVAEFGHHRVPLVASATAKSSATQKESP